MAYVGTPRYQQSAVYTIASILQGESPTPDGMQAVASVMQNRALQGGFGGSDIMSVALAKDQFQGQAPPSPQAMAVAQQLLNGTLPDNTGGATFYANPNNRSGPGATTAPWALRLNANNAVQIGGNYFTDNTQGAPFRGVQTVTPTNAADAMVPPSGTAPIAQADAQPTSTDLLTPARADIRPTTPTAPNGPSGAPAMVNGIINNNPKAIQAASQQIASDIQNGKITQDQVQGYFQSLPADVSSAAKANWLSSSDNITQAVNAGINNSSALVKGISLMPAALQPAAYTAGIKQADQGLATLANAPTVSPWTTDWNKVAVDPNSAGNLQAATSSINASVPSTSNPFVGIDRSLGTASADGSAPVGPAYPSAGTSGAGFSNFTTPSPATNYVRPDASSATPSPVAPDQPTSWGGPAGSSPLTAALAQANPAAGLTPDTGTSGLTGRDPLTGALAGNDTLAGNSFLPAQPQAPVASAPYPTANTGSTPQPIRISYGPRGVPNGPTYMPGVPITVSGNGPASGNSNTNAWSGGFYSGAMPGGYTSNYGFGSLGGGQFGNLGAASQYGGGAYGAPGSTT